MVKISQAIHWFAMRRPQTVLVLCGLFGLVASMTLTLEKIHLLQDPSRTAACSLNPIITCTSAMSSAQAEVLGIPNSLIGVAAYTALLVVAGLLLLGATLPKIAWHSIVLAASLGTAGMVYLLLQSVFVLHVICPWCFGIWVTTPLVLVSCIILYAQHVDMKQLPYWIQTIAHVTKTLPVFIIAIWLLVLTLLLGINFWDYWSTLL